MSGTGAEEASRRNHKRNPGGDPGVGGLLADPLAPSGPHDRPDPEAGPPSPDPASPRHHGDWSPTRKESAAKAERRAHPLMGRRRSTGGMPLALFREGDGMSLDDIRALEQIAARR